MKITTAIAIILLVMASTAFAQVYHNPARLPQNPTNPINPQIRPPSQPQVIYQPTSPQPTFSESMSINTNTGTITIIQQQGTDTFTTTY